ncbi:hypothetical protein Trydic_g1268 [Trypoxylus dichotomus]
MQKIWGATEHRTINETLRKLQPVRKYHFSQKSANPNSLTVLDKIGRSHKVQDEAPSRKTLKEDGPKRSPVNQWKGNQ